MLQAFLAMLRDNIDTLIPSVIAIITASAWWKSKNGWWKTLIEKMAAGAVADVEESYVKPFKEKNGYLKLPAFAQDTAKNKATVQIKDALASAGVKDVLIDAGINLIEQANPAIGAAIEKAVKNMKVKAPQATLNKFPCWLLFVVIVTAISLPLSGCMTVPAGWAESNADNVEAVALAAAPLWSVEQPTREQLALRRIADIGAASYLTARRIDSDGKIADKNACLKVAAKAMAEYAGYQYEDLIESIGGLPVFIRNALDQPANDADQVLGLLLAGIRAKEAKDARAVATAKTRMLMKQRLATSFERRLNAMWAPVLAQTTE